MIDPAAGAMKTKTVPHPIPYQGSKRNLAVDILRYFPPRFTTLLEPFAGSAAMTIAAAVNGSGERYHINDLNKPLMDLWRAIIETPDAIAAQYEASGATSSRTPAPSTIWFVMTSTGRASLICSSTCWRAA
jgi:site-specific DNA-adenine methylase